MIILSFVCLVFSYEFLFVHCTIFHLVFSFDCICGRAQKYSLHANPAWGILILFFSVEFIFFCYKGLDHNGSTFCLISTW